MNGGTTGRANTAGNEFGVSVVVSYIVHLLKAGNGIPSAEADNANSSSMYNDFFFCLTSGERLENKPPSAFMPIGQPPPQHADPDAESVGQPPADAPQRVSLDAFAYNPNTPLFSPAQATRRLELWGLLEASAISKPVGHFVQSPPSANPTQIPQSLFPNASGLHWVVSLLAAPEESSPTGWSELTPEDVRIGSAFMSEHIFVSAHQCRQQIEEEARAVESGFATSTTEGLTTEGRTPNASPTSPESFGDACAEEPSRSPIGQATRHGSSLTDLSPPATLPRQAARSPNPSIEITHSEEFAEDCSPGNEACGRRLHNVHDRHRSPTSPTSISHLLWPDANILSRDPYSCEHPDRFEDTVRSIYSKRIARCISQDVMGAAVTLFLRYLQRMANDYAVEFLRHRIVHPEKNLLPCAGVTWTHDVWIPEAVVQLRRERGFVSRAFEAALEIARAYHDSISPSDAYARHRQHIMRTLTYDVTCIPPHAFVDALLASHAGQFVSNTLGKAGQNAPGGQRIASPGKFIRSVQANIDFALQFSALVTSCRHLSWIAAAAIAESLLWFDAICAHADEETGQSPEAVWERYSRTQLILFRSLFDTCGAPAALYVKKAVDTLNGLRSS